MYIILLELFKKQGNLYYEPSIVVHDAIFVDAIAFCQA